MVCGGQCCYAFLHAPTQQRQCLRHAVSADDDVGVAVCLVGAAVVARRLGTQTRFGRAMGGPVTAMALTFSLSSASIMPSDASLVPVVRDGTVKLATPLLLAGADARDLMRTSGPFLRCFCVAALVTLASSAVGWLVAGRSLAASLGARDASAAAAALLAKNIGGGVNFAAVAQATRMSPQAQATALAVDNVMALVYFPAVSAAAGNVLGDLDQKNVMPTNTSTRVDATGLLDATLAGLLVLAAAQRLAPSATLPAATLLALVCSTISPRSLKQAIGPPAAVLSESVLYLFFATAGCAGASIAACAKASGPHLLLFLLCLYGGHTLGLLLAAPLLRPTMRPVGLLRPALAIASNACIGGPATAASMCQAKGWYDALPHAICVGTFGYAIASFLGLGLHASFFSRVF